MNTPQVFIGICRSLTEHDGQSGKKYSKLTLTAPNAYKRQGQTEPDWFDIEFIVFGRVAQQVSCQFQEGYTAAVWYDLGTKTRGQYTNINLSVRRVLIFNDGTQPARKPQQPQNEPEPEHRSHAPF